MKIGLFFGSFNPIHIGHAMIARFCLEQERLNEIWFIVSPHNPFKTPEEDKKNPNGLSILSHRFQMVKKICKQDLGLQYKAIDVEYSLPKPSYTADTLKHLESIKENSEDTYVLIMGSDSLHQLEKWKDYKYILENYPILVYPRPGTVFSPEFIDVGIYNIKGLDNLPLIEMSSTLIRERVKKGLSIQYMVPEVIRHYIERNKLYSK